MAQGDVFIDGDGKIGIDATGKIRLVDVSSDCPECCVSCTAVADPLDNCTHCDDVTPAQYTVTFSTVSLCAGCIDFIPTTAFGHKSAEIRMKAGFSLNDIYTVSQSASLCLWTTTISGAIEVRGSTADDCSSPTGWFAANLLVTLETDGTNWTIRFGAQGSLFLPSNTMFYYDVFAVDTDGADPLCGSVPASANLNTTCGAYLSGTSVGAQAATGGTAAVVCV
ncbi:hypothetical protein N9878_01260 [bacterium]|nr:hypothetical protein [bacterium]